MLKFVRNVSSAALVLLASGAAMAAVPAPGPVAVPAPDWLSNWLSGPLPGQGAAKAPAIIPPPPVQAAGSAVGKPAEEGWLEQWLSGPLPGQTAKAASRYRPPRQQTVAWPRAYMPPQAPFRTPASGGWSESPSLKGRRGEFDGKPGRAEWGVGLVLSSGGTTWNHDATSASASLGNPSSELTYSDARVASLEFTGKLRFGDIYFLRGNLGVGVTELGEGNFRDDDFLTGQVLFSSTDSAIIDTGLFYATADVGKDVARFHDGRAKLSLFAGVQYWREEYNAYGLYNRLTGAQTQTSDTLVLTNVAEWTSLRLGALLELRPSDRLRLTADLAIVPYANMHNEDSHWLRTGASQLGPAPNVVMDGSGFGFEGLFGVEYFLTPQLIWNADVRYWTLAGDGTITTGANNTTSSTFPLNDLDTSRFGVQMGLKYLL